MTSALQLRDRWLQSHIRALKARCPGESERAYYAAAVRAWEASARSQGSADRSEAPRAQESASVRQNASQSPP